MLDNSSSNSTFHYWQSLDACFPIFVSLFLFYILLFLPLFISVLYEGYRRWRKQRSGATSETSSHSDVFTYHTVAMELISVLGSCFYGYGDISKHMVVFGLGMYLWTIIVPGQNLFHILTCVERYLAVVHPVTYLRLKRSGGVRIRNIIIGCVWLISFVTPIVSLSIPFYEVLQVMLLLLSWVVVLFCSLSVLRVLIRPRPGDQSRERTGVDQSKRRAFQTMVVIMGALTLRFLASAVNTVVVGSLHQCVMMWSLAWLSLPSHVVLPLLFLHRAGKLPSCRPSRKSG